MEYLKNKYIVTLYIILGIIIYVLGILFTGGYIGIKEIILGIIMFVVFQVRKPWYCQSVFRINSRSIKYKNQNLTGSERGEECPLSFIFFFFLRRVCGIYQGHLI